MAELILINYPNLNFIICQIQEQKLWRTEQEVQTVKISYSIITWPTVSALQAANSPLYKQYTHVIT